MAGLLSRIKNGNAAADKERNEDAPLCVGQADLLSSLEKSDLGWFWSSDAEGNLSYLSESAARRIGKPADELTGKILTE